MRCTGINIFTIEYESAFKKELNEILNYITNQLHNEYAAKRLLQSIDTAVIKRNFNPCSYEIYKKGEKLEHIYYRIYVRNYTIFYYIENSTMKVSRNLYSKSNLNNLVKEENIEFINEFIL